MTVSGKQGSDSGDSHSDSYTCSAVDCLGFPLKGLECKESLFPSAPENAVNLVFQGLLASDYDRRWWCLVAMVVVPCDNSMQKLGLSRRGLHHGHT